MEDEEIKTKTDKCLLENLNKFLIKVSDTICCLIEWK